MPLPHPNAKKTYIVYEGNFDGSSDMVLVIETDLITNPQSGAFDDAAFKQLIADGKAYVKAKNRQVDHFRIIPTTDVI